MSENEFIQSFDEYSDAIFRFAFLKTSNRGEAEDITQDTFTKTWLAIGRGVEIDNIRAFLYATARNLIIDHYRKKKTESLDETREGGFDRADSSHEQILFDAEAKTAIAEINNLDEKYREIMYLRLVEGLGPKDISEVTGDSENSVSVKINRGIKMIREKLSYS